MSRGMELSFLCFLQIVIVIVLILLHHNHQTCDAISNNQTYCPPSSCGKITDRKHPFRLKGDPTACGDQRYELSCENNITTLVLFSGKYVKSIDYKNYTIRLVDPGIEEGDCSTIPRYYLYASNFTDSYNYSYKEGPFQTSQYRIISRKIDDPSPTLSIPMFQHVIYMNCSNHIRDDDPVYVDTASCINGGHLYAIAGDVKVGNLTDDDCHVEIITAISFFGYNYSSEDWDIPNEKFSYSDIHRMLVGGFEVSWMSAPCEDHCGQPDCYWSEITLSLRCDSEPCKTTLRFAVGCEPQSKLRMFVEGIMYGIAKGLLQTIGVAIHGGSFGISESKLGIDIGKIIGMYILSSYIIVRMMLGLIVFFTKLIHIYRTRHTSVYENIEDFLQGNSLMPIRYSYKEIKKMTRGFKDKLGEGGYGKVYKGMLRSGPLVADDSSS